MTHPQKIQTYWTRNNTEIHGQITDIRPFSLSGFTRMLVSPYLIRVFLCASVSKSDLAVISNIV